MLDPTTIGDATLYCGDCREVMAGMDADSVDAIVTDPPYGLAFMGKAWDHGVPGVAFWQEALRVAKLGAYLVAAGSPRTHHRLMVAIEDAGWEIRDCVMWVYGSGFPKSRDIGKDIEKIKVGGIKNLWVIGERQGLNNENGTKGFSYQKEYVAGKSIGGKQLQGTIPVYKITNEWAGWGTALKPAWEPIIVARKPPLGTIAQNVLRYGTGGLNVDGCRVDFCGNGDGKWTSTPGRGANGQAKGQGNAYGFYGANAQPKDNVRYESSGRYPANLIHSGEPEVVGLFPKGRSSGMFQPKGNGCPNANEWSTSFGGKDTPSTMYNDTGSAARFFQCCPFEAGDYDPLFYTGKATKKDRDAGCEGLEEGPPPASARSKPAEGRQSALGAPRRNFHPTVKPLSLMRYLVRLVTPPNGLILDPFAGSGSTGKAALLEGFRFVGIDLEPEHVAIAKARLEHIQCKQGLFADE